MGDSVTQETRIEFLVPTKMHIGRLIERLSWRPPLSFPCHRISYKEEDIFCDPAALAALPSEILCRCMPDIFAQSGLRMAFSLRSFKAKQSRAI
jgi:hypothetical protein